MFIKENKLNKVADAMEMLQKFNYKLEKRCEVVQDWKNNHLNGYCWCGNIKEISINKFEKKVYITTEECLDYNYGPDEYRYSFTFEELMNDDWHEKYLLEYQREMEEEKKKKDREHELNKLEQEERERREYLRLKEKFEKKMNE